MDRVVLIEFLALALLINAVLILIVLRMRRNSVMQDDGGIARASTASPPARPTGVIAVQAQPDAVGPGPAQPGAGAFTPRPDGSGRWPDAATTEWAERIRAETARSQRYGRAAAIIAMRLDGLEALTADAGVDVGHWLCRVTTRNLRAIARDADLIQSDGRGSFRVFLAETDEAGARTYVERAARLVVPWPDDPHPEIRLIAGWAGTWLQPDLEAADRLALARMVGSSEGWIRSGAAWRS